MPTAPDSLMAALPNPLQAGWIDAAAPLVMVIVVVVRQVLAAMAEKRAEERARQLQPPQPLDADAAEAQAPQGELRSEVEEFLRRVNEAREGQAPAAEEDPAPRGGPVDPFEEPRRRPRRKKTAPPPEPAIELILDPEPQNPKPRAELRHLPESQLAEEAAHLGERIASTDERTDARLHEKFDHRLGRIQSDAPTQDTPAPAPTESTAQPAATRIKGLLSRPGGVREAVVLSEILRRRSDNL